MKKVNLFVFGYLGFIGLIQAQGLFVEYAFNYVQDTIDKNNIRIENMSLYVNSHGDSYYISSPKIKADSINFIRKDEVLIPGNGPIRIADFSRDIPKFKIQYSLEKIGGVYKIRTTIPLRFYLIEEQILPMDWRLLNETKEQYGYRLKKAEIDCFDRRWVAWYTEEIPFHEGPYKFKGLPGLIVELHDENKWFHFQLNQVKLHSSTYTIFENYRQFLPVERDAYTKIMEKYLKNPLMSLEGTNHSIPNEQSFLERKQAYLKRYNNPLEKRYFLNLK